MKKRSRKPGKNKASKAKSQVKVPRRGSSRVLRVENAMTALSRQKIEARAKEFKPAAREIYQRAMSGRSRKDAMTAFCTMCMGYQSEEVKRCTDPACPLYPYRR